MATDSSELTFVRCPACRSLVPAVSTRCRMCGATLEAGAKNEEAERDNRQSGRVRQRTMSTQQGELSSALNKVRSENPPPETEAPEVVQAAGDDPLSEYIEEIDVVEAEAKAPEAKKAEAPASSGSHTEEIDVAVVATPPAASEAPAAPSEPRVVVETGQRRGGKQGLSFGNGGRGEQRQDRREERNEKRHNQQPQQQQQNRAPQQQESREARHEQREHREERREERNDRQHQQPQIQRSTAKVKPTERTGQPGRLFGWLVSYSDPDGAAVELREGKFFVTARSLKDSDMIIDDRSVSTPHALVTVSPQHGVHIQDLMSERGIFVRPRDGETYQRADESVSVTHGDWLRFGDVEFLVSLIPHVGVK